MDLTEDVEENGAKEKSARFELALRARRRDFAVLTALTMAILLILFASGTLALSEALTAALIFIFSATAFYLSSDADARDGQIMTQFAAERRQDAMGERALSAGRQVSGEDVRTLIEAYPQPALISDFDGRVYFANAGAGDVFRLPKGGIGIGPSIIRRVDMLRRLEAIKAGRPPEPMEIEIEGTPDRHFSVWTAPLSIHGEPRVLVVLIELTELRRAEKARADFLANASHELRTPLTSLAGFIETMRGPAKDDPEAWDRFLEIMYGQTERMRRLIHDLLSLSRIELSEHRRPDKVVDFGALVEENYEAMLPVARERGIKLEFLSSVDQANVYGVKDELTQVLQNLIDNAIKYTTPGSSVLVEIASGLDLEEARLFTSRRWNNAARISISQARPDADVPLVAIRVSDEGQGINREHLPRLGERFYRVDEGRDRTVGGTGLGLAIVKHIITRHRGGLLVESETGRGSAFGIWLPMVGQKLAQLKNSDNTDAPASDEKTSSTSLPDAS